MKWIEDGNRAFSPKLLLPVVRTEVFQGIYIVKLALRMQAGKAFYKPLALPAQGRPITTCTELL